MTLTWTRFKDHHATQKHVVIQSWTEFIKTIQASGPYPNKKVCPWLKLAQFGEKRTDKNSLRHDGNMLDITGIEGDYDGEVLHPDAALKLLEAAGIKCLIYTSASHTVDKPRWRVLAPLSRSFSPTDRSALLGRVNGVLGGVLSNESFTLSQGYFYGAVQGGAYRVLTSFDDPDEGSYLDELDELDNIAVFPHRTKSDPNPPGGTIAETYQQLGRKLKAGDQRRDMVRSFIATHSNRAVPAKLIATLVESTVAQYFDPADPVDWSDINQMIQTFTQHDIKQRQTDKVAMDAYVVRVKAKLAARAQAEEDEQVRLAEMAGEDEEPVHPLARFVSFGADLMVTRWIIPGFIGHGLTVIAGAHGVGKTTALLPLAMVAAGLHEPGCPLAPDHWRHVVYVTEDTEQAKRIIAGLVIFGGLGLDMKTVQQRLHLVEAQRLDPRIVAKVGKVYKKEFTRTVQNDIDILPLIVFDTKAAVISMEDENSNSESSKIVALLKQNFESLPVWLIGHIPKANMTRADTVGLSMRGGSAFEADANQVLYLIKEANDQRYLVRGKTRFEGTWAELEVKTDLANTTAFDEFGVEQNIALRWCQAVPPEQSRMEAQESAKDRASAQDAADLRDEIRSIVDVAWRAGNPFNRQSVMAKIKRRKSDVSDCIQNLLSEQWLHEVFIPSANRTHPRRDAFLINLTSEEWGHVTRGGDVPSVKLAVPNSWIKLSK